MLYTVTYVCMYVCIYIYILYVCMYLYIYTYVCMCIQTYMYVSCTPSVISEISASETRTFPKRRTRKEALWSCYTVLHILGQKSFQECYLTTNVQGPMYTKRRKLELCSEAYRCSMLAPNENRNPERKILYINPGDRAP